MQNLILISGRGGSGKSTVSQYLFSNLNDTALIQADKMVDFEPFEIGEKLHRIKMRNCSALIATYLKEGVRDIICEGFVQNQFELNEVEQQFKDINIYVFWLELDKASRHSRVKSRGRGSDDDPSIMDIYESASTEPWPFHSERAKLTEISVKNKLAKDVCIEIRQILAL